MPVAKRHNLRQDRETEHRLCSTMMSADVEVSCAGSMAWRQQGGRPLASPFEGCEPSLECAGSDSSLTRAKRLQCPRDVSPGPGGCPDGGCAAPTDGFRSSDELSARALSNHSATFTVFYMVAEFRYHLFLKGRCSAMM